MNVADWISLGSLAANVAMAVAALYGVTVWRKQTLWQKRQEAVIAATEAVLEFSSAVIFDANAAAERFAAMDATLEATGKPPLGAAIEPHAVVTALRKLEASHARLRALYDPDQLRHLAAIEDIAEEFRVAYANEATLAAYAVGPEAGDVPKDFGWDWSRMLKGEAPDIIKLKKFVDNLTKTFRGWANGQLA